MKSFPSKSLVAWRANRVDLNIKNEDFRYIVHDTAKYKEMMQVIPKFIPKEDMLLCKFQGCAFQATDMESFLKHSSVSHFTWSKLQCAFCPNIDNFSSAPVLRDHYEKHSSKEIFICGRCNTFSSCKKLLTEHARLSHTMEDVVILEIIRDEFNFDPISNYSISLRDDRKTISTFATCIFCDMDLMKKSLEEHLIEHHFFKLYYSCWKCDKVVCRNPYDLDSHFSNVHSGVSKISLNLKLRFDVNEDEFLAKREEPVAVKPVIAATEPIYLPQIEIKEEVIEIDDVLDDFIDIEDNEPTHTPSAPVSHIKIVPITQMMDPRFLNGSN